MIFSWCASVIWRRSFIWRASKLSVSLLNLWFMFLYLFLFLFRNLRPMHFLYNLSIMKHFICFLLNMFFMLVFHGPFHSKLLLMLLKELSFVLVFIINSIPYFCIVFFSLDPLLIYFELSFLLIVFLMLIKLFLSNGLMKVSNVN